VKTNADASNNAIIFAGLTVMEMVATGTPRVIIDAPITEAAILTTITRRILHAVHVVVAYAAMSHGLMVSSILVWVPFNVAIKS
jgi:hypothetical protein